MLRGCKAAAAGAAASLTLWNAKATALEAPPFDTCVIGGGVVGLAVARECAARGYTTVLLEREESLAACASSGNSGLGCTGYDAPAGSLERRLLRRSIQRHQHLYRSFGLSHDHVRKCGSLVVAWTPAQLAELPAILAENREGGDEEAMLLDQEELRELEPGLSHGALGAVLCPYEAVVEPWLVPVGYAESARLHGASIRTSTAVVGATFEASSSGSESGSGGVWRIAVEHDAMRRAASGRSKAGELLVPLPMAAAEEEGLAKRSFSGGRQRWTVQRKPVRRGVTASTVAARVVINCAGLHGDAVDALKDEAAANSTTSSFTIVPRKGQFIVFAQIKGNDNNNNDNDNDDNDNDDRRQLTHIIEPVPTQFTKGVIIFQSVYGNLIVGPTAVNQTDRFDRSTDLATVAALKMWGEKALPMLKGAAVLGTYSGLRPSTEHRDYQIKSNFARRWITVGGIRSTGLTASSGIAEYVADLLVAQLGKAGDGELVVAAAGSTAGASASAVRDDTIVVAPDGLTPISAAARNPERLVATVSKVSNARVPPLAELARNYRERGDGFVEVYGRPQRVTHPISSFGMGSYGE